MVEFRFREAYEVLTSNIWLFLPTILYVLFMVGMIALILFLFISGSKPSILVAVLLALSFFVLLYFAYVFVFTVTAYMARTVSSKGRAGFTDFVEAVVKNTPGIIVVGLIIEVLSLPLMLTVVGPTVLLFFLYFTPLFLARGEGVSSSIKKSYLFVRGNLKDVFLLYVLYFGCMGVSGYLLYIPLLFLMPWVIVVSTLYLDDRLGESGVNRMTEST
jgi:hypothetical protein